MNLKESYRYANYLDALFNRAMNYLLDDNFITVTIEKHLRSKVDKDASDENIIPLKQFKIDYTPNALIEFVVDVVDEKSRLTDAIAAAKATTEINIDSSISINKLKQNFVKTLKFMDSFKTTEKQDQGADYRFNVNNEQVRYFYPIIKETTIDFDRNVVKKLIKKYLKDTDDVSSKLDEITINTVVDFTPKYDVNESFEDAIAGGVE